MEFKVDLNELPQLNQFPNLKFRYYFGVLAIVFSLLLLLYNIHKFHFFFILYSFFLFILGLQLLYEGKGKLINALFGERFVKVNDELIEIKLKSRGKSEVLYWDNIQSINFAPSNITIITKDNRNVKIEYGMLSYTVVQKFKEALTTIAKEKNVI